MIFDQPEVSAEAALLRAQLQRTLDIIRDNVPHVQYIDAFGYYNLRTPVGVLAKATSDMLKQLKSLGY